MNKPNPQAAHYESIHDDYTSEYYDAGSMRYRNEFIYDLAFSGVDFNGKTVADLACGSGYNSLALLERFPQARPVGFDISESACADYRRLVGHPAHVIDLTNVDGSLALHDAAMVFGGLHHCVLDLDSTLRSIAGMLKPGGLLTMLEPNRDYALEGVRNFWYRNDRYFEASSEAALSHNDIHTRVRDLFDVEFVTYRGGPAYFLILNSLIFRLPKGLKRAMTFPLIQDEHLYNKLPGRRVFPYFIARWRRNDRPLESP